MSVTTRAVMVDGDGAMVAPALATFVQQNGLNGSAWTLAEILPSTTAWPGTETAYYVRVPTPPGFNPQSAGTLSVKRVVVGYLDDTTGGGTATVKVRWKDSGAGNSATDYTLTVNGARWLGPGPDSDDVYDADFTSHPHGVNGGTVVRVKLRHSAGTAPKGAYIEVEWQIFAA